MQRSYTHFVITDSATSQGTQFSGFTPGMAQMTVNVYGNTAYGNTVYTPGVPVFRPTASASAIVAMLRSDDPRSRDASQLYEIKPPCRND